MAYVGPQAVVMNVNIKKAEYFKYAFNVTVFFLRMSKWFPKSQGFATAVIMFGFGTGSLIFNQMQTLFINPNNYPPDKPYSDRFPDEKYLSIHI